MTLVAAVRAGLGLIDVLLRESTPRVHGCQTPNSHLDGLLPLAQCDSATGRVGIPSLVVDGDDPGRGAGWSVWIGVVFSMLVGGYWAFGRQLVAGEEMVPREGRRRDR